MVIYPVAPGGDVNAVHIADALRADERGDGTPGDRPQAALDRLPRGTQLRVADQVHVRTTLRIETLRNAAPVQTKRIKKDLRGHTPVYMQLIVALPLGLDLNYHRREDGGDGGRGQYDVLYELQGVGDTAGGDARDIPHDRPVGIEIGGPDIQHASLAKLDRDLLQYVLIHMFGDQRLQGRAAGGGIARQGLQDIAFLEQVLSRILGK